MILVRRRLVRRNASHRQALLVAMSFFRTQDRRRDRSIGEAARVQRRQQRQVQQQVIEQQQAETVTLQPAG